MYTKIKRLLINAIFATIVVSGLRFSLEIKNPFIYVWVLVGTVLTGLLWAVYNAD